MHWFCICVTTHAASARVVLEAFGDAQVDTAVIQVPHQQRWTWRAQTMMSGRGKWCCQLADHTHRQWEMPSMMFTMFMLYSGIRRIMSGQQVRVQAYMVHTGKGEGSSTVCPVRLVECTGQKKVLPPKPSESPPLGSNLRGVDVDSGLDFPRPVVEQLLLQQLPTETRIGGTKIPLPFCPSFTVKVSLCLEFMVQI